MKYVALFTATMLLSVQSLAQEGQDGPQTKELPSKVCVLTKTGKFHVLPQHNLLVFQIYDINGEEILWSAPIARPQEPEDTTGLKDNETPL